MNPIRQRRGRHGQPTGRRARAAKRELANAQKAVNDAQVGLSTILKFGWPRPKAEILGKVFYGFVDAGNSAGKSNKGCMPAPRPVADIRLDTPLWQLPDTDMFVDQDANLLELHNCIGHNEWCPAKGCYAPMYFSAQPGANLDDLKSLHEKLTVLRESFRIDLPTL